MDPVLSSEVPHNSCKQTKVLLNLYLISTLYFQACVLSCVSWHWRYFVHCPLLSLSVFSQICSSKKNKPTTHPTTTTTQTTSIKTKHQYQLQQPEQHLPVCVANSRCGDPGLLRGRLGCRKRLGVSTRFSVYGSWLSGRVDASWLRMVEGPSAVQ